MFFVESTDNTECDSNNKLTSTVLVPEPYDALILLIVLFVFECMYGLILIVSSACV